MADDEVSDSIRFAFEWRNLDFKTLFLYLLVLNLVGVGVEFFLKTSVNWVELFKSAQGLGNAILVGLLVWLVWSFVSSCLQLLVMSFALKSLKQKTRAFTAIDFIKYFLLGFVEFLAALFSVFNIRGLALLGASIILAVLAASLGSWQLWVLFGLVFSAYCVIFLYNLMRLSQSSFFFAGTNKSIMGSMRASLDATLGNVLWLCLLYLVVLIVVLIAAFVIVTVPQTIVGLFSGGSDSLAAKTVQAVLNPVLTFSVVFGLTSVFAFLLKRKKKQPVWNF